MSTIFDAIEAEDRAQLEDLLAEDPMAVQEVYSSDINYQPLHAAALIDNMDMANLLISAGADINAVGFRGRTPLHCTAYEGALDVCELLIEKGALLDIEDENGFTPVLAACYGREPSCIHIARFLKQKGAHIDINSAIRLLDIDTVIAILSREPSLLENKKIAGDVSYNIIVTIQRGNMALDGLDVDQEEESGSPAKLLNLLELLIRRGIDVNSIGFSGKTALLTAVETDNKTVVEMLMYAGADPNIPSSSGISISYLLANSKRAYLTQVMREKFGLDM